MKKTTLIFMLIFFSSNLFAARYIYTSDDGKVKLYVTQPKLGGAYVKSLDVKNTKCMIKQHGGFVKGHLNTTISINFATFGWPLPKNGTISGTLTNANIHSYAKNYVKWSNLTKFGCKIKAGAATLPHVQQLA